MIRIIILLLVAGLWSCSSIKNTTQTFKYNTQLAKKLGADDYGMRMYQLVILKTGTVTIKNKDTVNVLFRGHMDNIGRLADAGTLVIAGPFGKNAEHYRGLFIFKTKGEAETKALLQTDPAIKAGLLDAAIYPWYGSAALEMYLPYHKQIEKNKP